MILGHKRLRNPRLLMLGATPALLGAPILRFILLATHLEFPTAIIVGFVVLDMFFVPCFAYDLVIRGRIHRAYTYALTLFVVSEITLEPSGLGSLASLFAFPAAAAEQHRLLGVLNELGRQGG
jgi:hypothetical protein